MYPRKLPDLQITPIVDSQGFIPVGMGIPVLQFTALLFKRNNYVCPICNPNLITFYPRQYNLTGRH